jgi:predicted nucleic acid-binding protein
VPFLFDTDAISELLRPRPHPDYLSWIESVDRVDQFASAVSVGELFKGAFRSNARVRHLKYIEVRVLPAITVLPFVVATARVFGELRAYLGERGELLPDADLQIAASALHHELELVTGNVRHFERIPELKINHVLAQTRR